MSTIFLVFVIVTMAFAIGFDVYKITRDGKAWSLYKTFGVSIFCAVVLLAAIAGFQAAF
jgi:hypothetical protein